MLAAKAASALPILNTSVKCSIVPAPPDAIIGILTVSESLAKALLAKPFLVPS